MEDIYKPEFFRLNNKEQKAKFDELLSINSTIIIYDEIDGQLRELVKSLHPSIKIKEDEYPVLIDKHLNGTLPKEYGVWVYYSWANRLVHLLDETEFVEVRTNRNRYKITKEEQQLLATKKIGIVGLSVGQSIALSLAMERTCGEIRLADFDTAELSNLNRIRTGVHNLGVKKTIIAAREILEIDPYLNIKIFNDGLTKDNIDDFFTGDGKLDMLVEVCDGLNIKIISRFKARELKIPVVMDTNDRGMLDVERFDLEPDRPILHGLAGDLDPEMIKDLSNEDKVPYILKMIGAESISTRLKASMMEVEQSINTWPQLASSVVLGGALTTDVARRILLNQFHESGRYYVDIEEIIADKNYPKATNGKHEDETPAELMLNDLKKIAASYSPQSTSTHFSFDKILPLVQAACMAPSGGNAQPWKFLLQEDKLYIFHDAHFSYSLLDYNNTGSYIAFGAMLENIEIEAAALGIGVKADIFPLMENKKLVAVISFSVLSDPKYPLLYLAPVIATRMTNRSVQKRTLLSKEEKDAIAAIATTIKGAELQLYDEDWQIEEFAEVLTNAERIRFMHEQGHYDTFVKELRFTKDEIESTRDGLDIDTLNMSNSDKAALQIAKDASAISFLNKLKQGTGFRKISEKNVKSAGCMGILTMDGNSSDHFLQAGKVLERVWLEANYRGISVQPITQIIFMLERFRERAKLDFNEFELEELANIKDRFYKLANLKENRHPVFVFRLFHGMEPKERALRKPVDKVLFVN